MVTYGKIGIFLKRNKDTVVCIFLLSVFLSITGIVATLFLMVKLTNTSSVSIGERRYSLIDNLLDDDSFREFRHDERRLNNLGAFYNRLIQMENAKLLSLHTQPVNIDNFRGEKQFYYNTDAFLEEFKDTKPSIKALQINNIAYEYYGLQVKRGKTFEWDGICYDNKILPVVLGSNYESVYDIGDIIEGSYLIKDFKFEVIGILKEKSYIYYKTDSKFDISNYIIMPYPIRTWKLNPDDFRFEGMLYFNMINSDLVTRSGTKDFLDEIRSIANSTGFVEFSIVGIDQLLIKHIDFIYKMEEYKLYVFGVIFACFVSVTAIISKNIKVQKNCLLGEGKLDSKNVLRYYGKIYLMSFCASLVMQVVLIPRIYINVMLINAFILLCVLLITNFMTMK